MMWKSGRLAVFLLLLMEAAAAASPEKTHVLVEKEKLPVTKAEETEVSTKEETLAPAEKIKVHVDKAMLSEAKEEDREASTKEEDVASGEKTEVRMETAKLLAAGPKKTKMSIEDEKVEKPAVVAEKLPEPRVDDTDKKKEKRSAKQRRSTAAPKDTPKTKKSKRRTVTKKPKGHTVAKNASTTKQTTTALTTTLTETAVTREPAKEVSCWEGKVRLCHVPPSISYGKEMGCWRTVILDTFLDRSVDLQYQKRGDIERDPKLKFFFAFFEYKDVAKKNSSLDKDIRYLCYRQQSIEHSGKYSDDPTNTSRNIFGKKWNYNKFDCLCNTEDRCNMKPIEAQYTYEWEERYDNQATNYDPFWTTSDWTLDSIYGLIKKMKAKDFKILSRAYHINEEELVFPRGPSANVSAKLLNCASTVDNAEILMTALRWDIAHEDTDSAGCPDSPWKWQLMGEVHSTLSKVDYHFEIELQACPGLLHSGTSWAFLSREEVDRVFSPCDSLKPGETIQLQVDYTTKGQSMYLRWSDMELRPTPKTRLQCTSQDPAPPPSPPPPPPPPPLGLDELRQSLWVAIGVCLGQVAVVAVLLVVAVIRLEKADETISSFVSMSKDRLSPYRLSLSVPSKLVEDFGEHHCIENLSDDFEAGRIVSNDHRQLKEFNFFGWRTDLDYRAFPWFGKPPAVAAPVKCSCPDCTHLPRVTLERLIKPARLIEMGLEDWALVDRKDPLYHTFHGVRTEDNLPKDPSPRHLGSKSPGRKRDPAMKTMRSAQSRSAQSPAHSTSYVNDTNKLG